jgi:predicted transcriptional regulator
MKINQNKGKELLHKIAMQTTLNMFNVGSDSKNFVLLNKLPLTAREIEKELELTPMPVNRRIQELMKVGLIQRKIRGEKIYLTKRGEEFLSLVNTIEDEVVKGLVS